MTEGEYKELRKSVAQMPERDVRENDLRNTVSCHYSTYLQTRWVGIVTDYRAGRYWDRIPVGGEIFSARPDRP